MRIPRWQLNYDNKLILMRECLIRATFFNDPKRSYGKVSLYYRLEVLKELNFDLVNMDNIDILRVKLKNYFSYFEMIFEI